MARRGVVRLCLAAALACLAALLAVPATAEPIPYGYSHTDAWLTSFDGTQLHASVFLPVGRKATERHPVMLASTPYAAPGASGGAFGEGPAVIYPELLMGRFKAGRWAYVQVDVRGFGGSGGCFGYYTPDEARDVKVAVEWAAKQPWSAGRVGMWGMSYDGAQQVLALGAKPKGLAAAVIQAPGLSAYTALWMNGVHYATSRYTTTPLYTVEDLAPPQNRSTLASPEYAQAAAAPATASPTCRTDSVVRMNVERDRKGEFWKDREPYRQAAGSTVPTFWSHGFADRNTKPVHLDIWSSLRGPKQAWFGQYTHVPAHSTAVGRKTFLDEATRFLERHVLGARAPAVDPAVTVQSGNGVGRWRAERQWPPTDARPWTMPVLDGSYPDQPGNTGEGANAGQGSWTVTRPLAWPAHLAGEVVLRASVEAPEANAHVVAHLYDVDADDKARLVTRGAFATSAAGRQDVRFALYPQDWVFAKGHRIALVLSAADDDWFAPGTSMREVKISKSSLVMPLLRVERTTFLKGKESDGMNGEPFQVSSARTSREVGAHPPRQERR
ncbi:MAG TPA: CocE/NonD family hydrolase [Mycobacteriales bacterium]|nr:CocE/NonD family hydrolase [Mycobacteriales bacterium]